MPELPEIETITKELHKRILNKTIIQVTVYQHKLRWPIPKNISSILQGEFFHKITRRGKYLLLSAQKGTVIIHLGLTGRLIFSQCEHKKELHEHLIICFKDKTALSFIDPRKFGAFLWTAEDPEQYPLIKNLGIEPLTSEFNAKFLSEKIKNHKTPIKLFLMDSHIIAGVGNIYANEALFAAKINPLRPANSLSPEECSLLVSAIKKVLKEAIAYGGTTIKDFMRSDGTSGYFQNNLKVYGRAGKPCPNCKNKIVQTRLSGRSTFYCPRCQNHFVIADKVK